MSQTGSHDLLQQPIMTKEMTIALFRLMLWGLGVGSNSAVQNMSTSSQRFYALSTEDLTTDKL
jgi:hypothetical protein